MGDPNEEVRRGAIEALGNMGELAKPAIPKFIASLSGSGTDQAIRFLAAIALSQRKESASAIVPQLVPLLNHSDPDVRSKVAYV